MVNKTILGSPTYGITMDSIASSISDDKRRERMLRYKIAAVVYRNGGLYALLYDDNDNREVWMQAHGDMSKGCMPQFAISWLGGGDIVYTLLGCRSEGISIGGRDYVRLTSQIYKQEYFGCIGDVPKLTQKYIDTVVTPEFRKSADIDRIVVDFSIGAYGDAVSRYDVWTREGYTERVAEYAPVHAIDTLDASPPNWEFDCGDWSYGTFDDAYAAANLRALHDTDGMRHGVMDMWTSRAFEIFPPKLHAVRTVIPVDENVQGIIGYMPVFRRSEDAANYANPRDERSVLYNVSVRNQL